MSDNEVIDALESAVQGDAIFSVNVASPTLRALFDRLHEVERERDAAREALRPFAANAHLWAQRSVFDPVYVLIDDDAEIEPGALVIRAGALLSVRDITKEISE